MAATKKLPLVGLPACVRTVRETRIIHSVAEKYLDAVIDVAGCLPVLIPAIGGKLDLTQLLDTLDGLLLTGSPSNVEPAHYGGTPSKEGTLHDPARDATTLPLIREAIRRNLPVLAICRGIQELNAALGGTLHQRLHELPGRLDHRTKKDAPGGPYGPAHEVELTPDGLLAGLAGTDRVIVNSLHSQGIDAPASRLRVEAVAPDGQIEAVSLPGARFVVGVQWHPEYKAVSNPFSCALFRAFAEACGARSASMMEREIAA